MSYGDCGGTSGRKTMIMYISHSYTEVDVSVNVTRDYPTD